MRFIPSSLARKTPIPFLAIFAAAITANSARADAPVPPEKIDASIQAAINHLYATQKDGNWELVQVKTKTFGNDRKGSQWGGSTAIAVYALLSAGENIRGEKLAPAIDWLKKAEITGVYALAFRLLAYSRMTQTPEIRKLAHADLASLFKCMQNEGNARGMYDYDERTGKSYSHSRSQYGVLGAWAAQQMNIELPSNYWKTILDAWLRNQDPSGGWGYMHPADKSFKPSAGMTAAGIASLYLAYDGVGSPVGCAGNPKWPQMDNALEFLSKNMGGVGSRDTYGKDDTKSRDFPLPTLYAIERVGLATGLRYIGKDDWYRKGSALLVDVQKKDGGWSGGYGGPVADTSFALLFLVRGRTPLIMQKLEYTVLGADNKPLQERWNQRPRDAANFTRWMSRQTEREFRWQIANLSFPVEDMLESPILFLSGSKMIKFTPAEEQKLRDYVQRGGLILGHADCGDAEFARGFQTLGSKLFPMYEFRELPDTHVMYDRQMFLRKSWPAKPRVVGLSNGVREFLILLPEGDPGRSWANNTPAGDRAAHFQLMANLYLYAVDKSNLRSLQRPTQYPPVSLPATAPTIRVARLDYAGNADPEPGGWPRLKNYLAAERKIALDASSVKLGDGKLTDNFRIAHMTGTAPFTLTDTQRKELSAFIASGGVLLIDSAGGSEAFTRSAIEELEKFKPAGISAMRPLAPDDAIYTRQALPEDKFRDFIAQGAARPREPRLSAMTLNSKIAVIFSLV